MLLIFTLYHKTNFKNIVSIVPIVDNFRAKREPSTYFKFKISAG